MLVVSIPDARPLMDKVELLLDADVIVDNGLVVVVVVPVTPVVAIF
jgi:hypothetical protein